MIQPEKRKALIITCDRRGVGAMRGGRVTRAGCRGWPSSRSSTPGRTPDPRTAGSGGYTGKIVWSIFISPFFSDLHTNN